MSLVGGSSPKEVTRRILLWTPDPTFMATFSYRGRRDKLPFDKLFLNEILIKAVSLSSSGATEASIEGAIKEVPRERLCTLIFLVFTALLFTTIILYFSILTFAFHTFFISSSYLFEI